jgi:hypothetical protein
MKMKHSGKFVFMVLALCFAVTSCGEKGGTLIVKNNYTDDKSVAVYSGYSLNGPTLFYYDDKYGPKTIAVGGSASFDVTSDAKYTIVWYASGKDQTKTVQVSGGDTVEADIP